MSELPRSRRAIARLEHEPRLVRRDAADVGRAELAARLRRAAGRLRERDHVVHLGARAGMDLDRLDPLVLGQPGRRLEVLVRHRAARRNRELLVHREDRVGRADRPAVGEDRRRRQVLVVALRRAARRPTRRWSSISCFVSRGSFLNMPCGVSAPHGGIAPETTRCLIDLAHGRAASNVVSDIGANIVGRWHSTQLLLKIGATSFVNVGAGLPSALSAVEGPAANAAAGATRRMVKMSLRMELILPYGRVVGYLIPSCSR